MKDDNPVGESAAAEMGDGETSLQPVIEIDAEEPVEPGGDDPVQAELARLQQETDHLRELYMRKLADFDNFRKRKDKEVSEYRRQANAEMVRDLLPVVDNLERALAVGGEDSGGVRTGVELTLRQLKDVLGRHGVAEVDPAGEEFDPSEHEAVSRLHTASAEPNTVVQVLQKGYRLGDRLLRAALVVVAAPVAAPLAAPPATEGDR